MPCVNWKEVSAVTKRVLTTMGSATAVATVVGACLLLGPTAQASPISGCSSPTTCGTVTPGSGGGFTVTGINGGQSGTVTCTRTLVCTKK